MVHETKEAKKKEMTEPLEWELVPTKGADLALRHYRSLVDGQGWLVVVMKMNADATLYEPFAEYFVPDPNGKWGTTTDAPVRKNRWD